MITELVSSFDRSVGFIAGLVEDVPDQEMCLQPPGVPNHAAWTLGHVVFSCQAIAEELGVKPWLPADWESLFGYGSSPEKIVGHPYAVKADLLAALGDASAQLRRSLLAYDESRLGEPLPDEKARGVLPTVGHALLQVVAGHTAFHAGQLAVWRRATGRAPIGVFL